MSQLKALDGIHALDAVNAAVAHSLGSSDVGHRATGIAFDEQLCSKKYHGYGYKSKRQQQ